MQSAKVDVAPIHDVETPGLEGDLIENIHIVEFAVGDVKEAWDIAAQIEQGVEFHRPFRLAKARPRKQGEA